MNEIEIHSATNYDENAESKVKEIKEKLDGKTFFNLRVDWGDIAGPGICYSVYASCDEERKSEALGMAFSLIAE